MSLSSNIGLISYLNCACVLCAYLAIDKYIGLVPSKERGLLFAFSFSSCLHFLATNVYVMGTLLCLLLGLSIYYPFGYQKIIYK